VRKPKFSIEKAKADGRTDEEITEYLSSQDPKFSVQKALDDGRTHSEINDHLANYVESRPVAERIARVPMQAAITAAEMQILPLEIANMATSSEGYHVNENLGRMGQDIEDLYETYGSQDNWPESEKQLYEYNKKRIQNPSLAQQDVQQARTAQTSNIGTRGLINKFTDYDLHPEGFFEKAAGWISMLKDPKKGFAIAKEIGQKPTELVKNLIPGEKSLRSVTAASALELAESGNFGPIGTLIAAITGDALGMGPRAIQYAIKNPKELIANATNLFTRSNSKNAWQKQIIEDANELGIQLDAGTISNSNLIKFLQTRASQSGLTGQALDNFRKSASRQFFEGYNKIVDQLGELTFENTYQASEAIQQALKTNEVRLNAYKGQKGQSPSLQGRIQIEARPDYQQDLLNSIAPQEFQNSTQAGKTLKNTAEQIKAPIKEEFTNRYTEFNQRIAQIPSGPQGRLAREMETFVENNNGSLLLGESSAEFGVVRAAQNLANRLRVIGGEVGVSLSELLSTKQTLQDVANYEFGGSNFESAYKHLVEEVDNAIVRTLENQAPELLEEYQTLNHEYSTYKELFENKNVLPLFETRNNNFNSIFNGFTTNPDKLRALEGIFSLTPEGQQVLGRVKRDFSQKVLQSPNVTSREIRNLGEVLGPQYQNDLLEYIAEQEHAELHPNARIQRQEPLGITSQVPQTSPTPGNRPLSGRIKETGTIRADEAIRRKQYESLKNKDGTFKSSDQIFKQMDSIEGIRKLKRSLSTTLEGKELFNKLARFKLSEMIDKKMANNVTEQVKLGTFSKLLKTTHDKAIVLELIGAESFATLEKLQSVAGRMAESAEKFFNSSKTGVITEDVAMIGAASMGILTGNPYLLTKSIGGMVTMKLMSNLFADPKYLKLLEKAVLTNNPTKFMEVLLKMEPIVQRAIMETNRENYQ